MNLLDKLKEKEAAAKGINVEEFGINCDIEEANCVEVINNALSKRQEEIITDPNNTSLQKSIENLSALQQLLEVDQ